MKLNKPTTLTQGTETISGTLMSYEKGEYGYTLSLFVPKRAGATPAAPVEPKPVAVPVVEPAPVAAVEAPRDELAESVDAEEDAGPDFSIDFSNVPEGSGVPVEAPADPSAAQLTGDGIDPDERVERLLEPYSTDSCAKARRLLENSQVEMTKKKGESRWFNVEGSTLYVVKTTLGENFLFAECSCPNGLHRGGDAICYHSIAARAITVGLDKAWLS